MNRPEGFILSYLINSLWQVPLLYAAAWLAARVVRPLGPVIEHRIGVTALLLQALVPAFSLVSLASLPNLLFLIHSAQSNGRAHVLVSVGAGFANANLHLPTLLERIVAFLYVCLCLYFTARFIWRSVALVRVRREAMPLPENSKLSVLWKDFTNASGDKDVTLAISSRVFSPATIGVFRKLILLPAGMTSDLSDNDFHTILAHEFAHVRRRDFTWNLVYELVTLPISYHPIFWLTRENAVETREMVCDQAAARLIGPANYAHSLLRLATLVLASPPLPATHAIGIFDANAFERRLMTLTQKPQKVNGLKRAFVVGACMVFGVGTCGTALALRVQVDQPVSAGSHVLAAGQEGTPQKVPAGVMAGNIESKVQPVYPPDAKTKKIQGAVILHAIIGKDGKIDELTVISGPKELQESAMDAVSKWVYKPYLLNGEPTEVETTITINYSFG